MADSSFLIPLTPWVGRNRRNHSHPNGSGSMPAERRNVERSAKRLGPRCGHPSASCQTYRSWEIEQKQASKVPCFLCSRLEWPLALVLGRMLGHMSGTVHRNESHQGLWQMEAFKPSQAHRAAPLRVWTRADSRISKLYYGQLPPKTAVRLCFWVLADCDNSGACAQI